MESSGVKRDTPIMIVVGNPPYSGHSENKSEWISKLLKGMDIHAPNYNINGKEINTESYFMVDGNDLGERQPKWLNDDYVKFIRFSQWRIQNTGYGVLAFITNHGYLDNPTFRGMRQSLMKTFDKIYVLDLHGNAKKKETAPDGSKDENVFDIQQGVAIGIFIKDGSREKIQPPPNLPLKNQGGGADIPSPSGRRCHEVTDEGGLKTYKNEAKSSKPPHPNPLLKGEGESDGTFGSTVYHADLYGQREGSQAGKYERLLAGDIETTHWQKLSPQKPFYLFAPQNTDLLGEYNTHPKITDLFVLNNVGFVTARDKFLIDFDKNEIAKRINEFTQSDEKITDYDLEQKYKLKNTSSWSIREARINLRNSNNWKNDLKKCLYRPFDVRDIFYSLEMLERPVFQIMRHMLAGENLGLVFMRQVALTDIYSHFFATNLIIDNRCFYSNKGIMSIAPLYLYPDPKKPNDNLGFVADRGKDGRRPNLSPEIVKDLESKLCAKYVSDGKGNITKNQIPEPPLNKAGLSEGELTFGPEDIFNYIYAILHSPIYRTRYAEFLKIDFPRIPFTSNTGLFAKLAVIGGNLVKLHLLEDVDYDGIGFPELGDNKVEKLAYNEQKGEVWINSKQYFSGITQDVWEFHIGGYQVAQKWLKDRKGRTLAFEDIETYMKAMASIRETIILMSNIDETIEKNGGYPIS